MRFLVAVLYLGIALPALADNQVTVSATATIQVEPDVAIVSASVRTQDRDPAKALAENNEKMIQVFKSLEGLNIDKKNIYTSNFSLHARHEYNGQTGKSEFAGYSVSNTITIKVCELDTVGKLVSTLVVNGANRLNGVVFSVENTEELMEKARVVAVTKARAKAEVLVKTAGSNVGNLLTISEHSGNVRDAMSQYRMADTVAESAVPISGGEQAVSVTVSATFEILHPDDE